MAKSAALRKTRIRKWDKAPDPSSPLVIERYTVTPKREASEYRRKPNKRAVNGSYPWFTMKVGENFFVPVLASTDVSQFHQSTPEATLKGYIDSGLRLHYRNHPDKLKGKKFISIATEYNGKAGVRVWRVS